MSNSRSTQSTCNSQDAVFFAASVMDSLSALEIHCILLSSSSQPIAGFTYSASTIVAGNVPLHPGKCVGPTLELAVLAQVAHLPEGKLQALKELIHSWLLTKWCFRRDLNHSLAICIMQLKWYGQAGHSSTI